MNLLDLANTYPFVAWIWFLYITLHDPLQWIVLGILGYSAWGRTKHNNLIKSLKEELSNHMKSDEKLHQEIVNRVTDICEKRKRKWW